MKTDLTPNIFSLSGDPIHHKVYLSVSSEGYGHSSRGLAIASQFPIESTVIGSYNYALARFQHLGHQTVEIPQEVKFIGSQGSFDITQTILKNHKWALTLNQIIEREIEVIESNNISCVIADGRMAPVMAADKLQIPCLVVTNQSSFYPFFDSNSVLVKIFGKSFEWFMRTWLSSAEEIMIADFPPPFTICMYSLTHNKRLMKRQRFVGPLVYWDKNDTLPAITNKSRPYIVATLGGHEYRKPLFEAIILAAKYLPDIDFDLFTSFTATDLPHNVVLRGVVPSIAPYFKSADLVITQAGHSTAMEFLTIGVPALLVPDTNQVEQNNNAKKLKELGVAEIIDYENLTVDKLVKTISIMLESLEYKKAVMYMSEIGDQLNGKKVVTELIQEYSSRIQVY